MLRAFDIPGHVEVREQVVSLTHACGAGAKVALRGARITSWRQKSGDEVLCQPAGAQLCFPQFGGGPAPGQGNLAGLGDWALASTSADLQPDERDPSVELVLADSDASRALWPHAFRAVFTVTLHGEELQTDFRLINTGPGPFSLTAGLLARIEVADLAAAAVTGLDGLPHLDRRGGADAPMRVEESRAALLLRGPVDAVYLGGGALQHVEVDVGTGAAVALRLSGWEDLSVWAPGELAPGEAPYCCVGSARVSAPAVVEPGGSWRAQQSMSVIDLL